MLHECLFLAFLCLNYTQSHHVFQDQENDESYYKFRYGVRDLDTGDIKDQWEERKGGTVRGEYSLVEPDGTLRTVQYSADDKNGFSAIVRREGRSRHPTVNHQQFRTYLAGGSNEILGYEEPRFYPPEGYEVMESERKSFYSLPEVPPNHSPVYTGVSDYNKLMKMYKNFRKQNSDPNKNKFDYGIDKYFENGYAALKHRRPV